jgi:hypothetical protein
MKIGREAGIPNSVNDAAGGACNVVRSSFASMAERTVFNGRWTVQQPLPKHRRAISARMNRVRTDV